MDNVDYCVREFIATVALSVSNG